ncbi:MAG: 50S ribosomal protein L23 [Clostridia bacterium]|nr:50S ribosomal protein L23 [Clostridia bacterium]
MNAYDIIIAPIISEKSMSMLAEQKYTFKVNANANKIEIKKAIEEIFKVEVDKVTTLNVIGKNKRVGVHAGKKSDWKKAIVKLKGTKTIEFFESLR